MKTRVMLMVALFFSLFSFRCLAEDLLILTFDHPFKRFRDSSPVNRQVTKVTTSEGSITGVGVKVSTTPPTSPAGGGYAVFDGGSYLQVKASPSLVLSGDFTIRFWFKSTGIDRGTAFGKYRYRMHPLKFGKDSSDNLDITINDTDSNGRGLWTYWLGGGNPFIWTPEGTVNQFTDDRWYHYWLVREKGMLTLYIGDDQRSYTLIGTAKDKRTLGSPVSPLKVGSIGSWSLPPATCLCWLGALDDIRIANEALYPTGSCK